jgi:hypothetical protein
MQLLDVLLLHLGLHYSRGHMPLHPLHHLVGVHLALLHLLHLVLAKTATVDTDWAITSRKINKQEFLSIDALERFTSKLAI